MKIKDLGIRLQKLYFSRSLIWVLFALGAFLRLRQYAFNRSLWLDEAALAINFVTRSFSELLLPLKYGEMVPVGFIMAEKLAVNFFGPSEYALRLFPLIAGILAMFVFYRVAAKLSDPAAVPLALGIFAILQPLVYFSSEAKQYSFDVFIAVAILLLAVKIADITQFKFSQVLLYGLCGAVTVWFSHPAVFLLAGAALILVLDAYRKKRALPAQLIPVFSLWLVSFILCYLVSKRYLSAQVHDHLKEFWKDGFMPLVPKSFQDIKWYARTFFSTFKYPGGFDQPGLAAVAFLAGVVGYRSQRKTGSLGFLLMPIVLVLGASAFHLYPFNNRLILFILPLLILLIAEGAVTIKKAVERHNRFVSWSFLVLLFVTPALMSVYHVISPMSREEARPVIRYLQNHMQPTDVLYIYNGAQKAFDYYSLVERFDPVKFPGVNSRDNARGYLNDLRKVEGRSRVWILFSHIWKSKNMDEREFILNYLDEVGTRIEQFEVRAVGTVGLEAGDVAVYLYDLSKSFKE